MNALPRHYDTRGRWWLGYGSLIVVPALALAVLGGWAIRAERLQREEENRRRMVQTVRLMDSALETDLATFVRRLEDLGLDGRAEVGRNARSSSEFDALPVFSRDAAGLLAFHSAHVYDGPIGLKPSWMSPISRRSFEVRALVDRSLALEAVDRSDEAIAAYRNLADVAPELRPWASLGIERLRRRWRTADLDPLFDPEGLSPQGIPVAVLAATSIPLPPVTDGSRLKDHLGSTLERLRAGRWWLSLSQRDLYDSLLLARLGAIEGDALVGRDPMADSLRALRSFLDQAPPVRRDRSTRLYLRHASCEGLVLWAPPVDNEAFWVGTILDRRALAMRMETVFDAFRVGMTNPVAIEGDTVRIWSSEDGAFESRQWIRSSVLPEWRFVLGSPRAEGVPMRWIWTVFIVLLLTLLLTGLVLTMRLVRREMELAQMREEFVSTVTHEFRSPITAVRLLVERALGDRPGSSAQRTSYREAMTRELDRLQLLVDRLLVIRRSKEPGAAEIRPADPAAVLEEAMKAVGPRAREKDIEFDVRYASSDLRFSVDEPALVDSLRNLLDNAVTYSPEGASVRVRVDGGDGSVTYRIEDEGPGIPESEIEHIFDRFYRGAAARKTNPEGVGLGLALVRSVAEAHGGSVAVSARPGGGSVFAFRIRMSSKSNRNGEDSDRG